MPPPAHCLLIDNDEDDQEIFILALQEIDTGIVCKTLTSGRTALDVLAPERNYIPTHIFIDMNMPLMDGRECLQAIKKMEHLAHVPVYMYSTAANPSTIAEVMALGATDFIVKPASFKTLTERLSALFPDENTTLVK